MEYRIFRKIVYDTQFGNGTNELNFFTNTDRDDESVTLMTEEEVLIWLFQNPSFKSLLYESFFEDYENVESFLSVTSPFTTKNKKPGDIDLLIVDPKYPEKTFAFEFKRVKSIGNEDQSTKINNLENVKKGIKQVEFYKKLGFYQTYFAILLIDDGRKYDDVNQMFRITPQKYANEIWNIPKEKSLSESIGIVFIKVEQFTGKHINLTGSFGICIERFAESYEQSFETTQKIIDLIDCKKATANRL